MANQYSTVPLAWVDGLQQLNRALEVYQRLVVAWASRLGEDGVPGDVSGFVAGLDLIFEPILDGYRDIQSQVDSAKQLQGIRPDV